jgi:formate dehydrogenase iron-sulfur subunit
VKLVSDPFTTEPSAASETLNAESLLARILQEQREPSAVETFSRFHESQHAEARPAAYRALLPATPPGPGQQYAFDVDLDRCSGCKACVTACHALNGLDDNEAWRDVGLLVGGSRSQPVMQHVTAACHHCLEPGCLTACPVNAYEKDPLTGIVKHLDDQCFGCQYCTLACPYDVPKYHRAKGIVRKCDMCSSRLAVGEAPACVQACPHQAISIRLVDTRQVREDAEAATFLPAAPDPLITFPTTTYRSKRAFPRNLLPADYYRVNVQHAHWPLVVMLVLTQLSVGAIAVGLALERWLGPDAFAPLRPMHSVSALVFGLIALLASTLHLGRPWLAFRAVLGLGHSWLSREIVAFGVFAGLACAYAGAVTLFPDAGVVIPILGWSVVAAGATGVFASAMIYIVTARECWSAPRVFLRFLLTAALLGVATVWWSLLALTLWRPSPELASLASTIGADLCRAIVAIATVKLVWELSLFRHLLDRRMTAMRRSAMLMVHELSGLSIARFAVGALGGIVLPALLLADWQTIVQSGDVIRFTVLSGMLFVSCLAGELLERSLFFTACAAPRMPGGIR